jgi:hypothetical protein
VLPSSWPSPRVLSLRFRGRALRPEARGESKRGLGVADREEEGIMMEKVEDIEKEGARQQPVDGDLLASDCRYQVDLVRSDMHPVRRRVGYREMLYLIQRHY